MVATANRVKKYLKHGYISRRSANYEQCDANSIVSNKSLSDRVYVKTVDTPNAPNSSHDEEQLASSSNS